MPSNPDEIAAPNLPEPTAAAAGAKVVEMLGACAAAPDDIETGRAADDALRYLERLLAADVRGTDSSSGWRKEQPAG